MFTSSGYFRGINCPFYSLGNGTCRRPHCHFRHVRNNEETEAPQSNNTAKGTIDDVYPRTADIGNYAVQTPLTRMVSTTPTTVTKGSPVQYVPTPIAEIALARRRHKMAAKRKCVGKNQRPLYVPTPLSQISVQSEGDIKVQRCPATIGREDHIYNPTKPTSCTNISSNKYCLDQDHSTDEDEYDPLASHNLFATAISPQGSEQDQNPEELLKSPLNVKDSKTSVSSSKYQLQAHSDSISDLVYDPLNNSAYNRNSLRKSQDSLEKETDNAGTAEQTTTVTNHECDHDGLYNFVDDDDDNATTNAEYEPLHNEGMPSYVNAKYTPTQKYSVSGVNSKSVNKYEYDPLSNFSAVPKKRKRLVEVDDYGESSDSDALMIVENNGTVLTNEESRVKKQKYSDDVYGNRLEVSKFNEVDAGIDQESLLSHVTFHPPSYHETSIPPSYSYNPINNHNNSNTDSGTEEWNPTQYLTELAVNTCTYSKNSSKTGTASITNTSQASPVRKKGSVKGKVKASQEVKGRPVKIKPPIKTRERKITTVASSKCKDLPKKGQNADAHVPTGITGSSQQGKDCQVAVKPPEKSSVKISPEQLSSFFNQMSNHKVKPAKPKNASVKTGSHRLKVTSNKNIKHSQNATRPKWCCPTESPRTNKVSDNTCMIIQPKKVEQIESESSHEHIKQNSKNVLKCREPHQEGSVIVIDTSSSSEDNMKQQMQTIMESDPTLNNKEINMKSPTKIVTRKASNLMLFGDDSDNDSSDLQMMEQNEDEIVLISDGYSSRESQGKKKEDKWAKQHQSVAVSKLHNNSERKLGSIKKLVSNSSLDGKIDKQSKYSPQKPQSHKAEKDRQTKSDGCKYKLGSNGKKYDKNKDKRTDQSKSKKESELKKKKAVSPGKTMKTIRTHEDSVSQVHFGHDEFGDDDYAPLSDNFINDIDVSFSESDTFEECLRIFHEQTEVQTPVKKPQGRKNYQESRNEDLVLSTAKQRVAHVSRFDVSRHKKFTPRPKARPSPLQVCHNRYMQAQQFTCMQEQRRPEPSIKSDHLVTMSDSKRRIAHIPSSEPQHRPTSRPVMGINAKIQLKYSVGHSTRSEVMGNQRSTVAITAPKGERRIAHQHVKVNPRPIIPPDTAGKVPSNIRQRYLNLFIDEFLKTTETEQDAFEQGLKEEKDVYARATSKNIYLNLSVNTLKRLRNVHLADQSKDASAASKGGISHEAVIGGKPATQHTYTLHRSHIRPASTEQKYEGAFLYEKLKVYLMTEQQLVDNGYPRPSEISGHATIKVENSKKAAGTDPNQHVCSRCGSIFLRRPDGHYITRDSCTFHYGKYWNNKVGGSLQSRFSCCSGESDTKGCCIAKYHVTDDKAGDMTGFMKTVAKSPPLNGHPVMYAIDCEMCYTVKALELTRVTVIDDQLTCVYDTFVKPSTEIVDYNTRFSGITEDDLKCVTTTLQDVQAVILSMLSSDSILIGHSLESDLLALKMIHNTVLDTAILFPHRRGLPFKRALRTLMAEYLNQIIQNDVGGHDSQEDAKSCMQLAIWKAKQDAKQRKTTVYT